MQTAELLLAVWSVYWNVFSFTRVCPHYRCTPENVVPVTGETGDSKWLISRLDWIDSQTWTEGHDTSLFVSCYMVCVHFLRRLNSVKNQHEGNYIILLFFICGVSTSDM